MPVEGLTSSAPGDAGVWREFVRSVRDGTLDETRIRPHTGIPPSDLLAVVHAITRCCSPEHWPIDPRLVENPSADSNTIHALVPLILEGCSTTVCFSFIQEEGRWFLLHVESIILPIVEIPSLPATVFPDLPQAKKDWMREEISITETVRLWQFLRAKFGCQLATDWFKDGAGYALAAKSWLPFLPAAEAFILYLCWEQSRLRGTEVVLEELESSRAKAVMRPFWFAIYRQATHLRRQISEEDYRSVWEAVWKDRALNGGWDVDISCDNDSCTLAFARRGL